MRAIRGAITVESNTADGICDATQTLLRHIAERNRLQPDEIVSVIFSVTQDLTACFPARAARDLGWDAPMLDVYEMDVPGALAQCVRVLLHVDRAEHVQHVYLAGARVLRPDLEETS